MKRRKNFRTVRKLIALPDDLNPHRVQIAWIGREHLKIEHHRGIAGLNPHEVRLFTEQGTLVVLGDNMTLKELSDTDAFLFGRINGIFFEDESSCGKI